MQALEPRLMLAGNVSAAALAGRLYLNGDHQANQVWIRTVTTAEAAPVGWEVIGQDTTINGKASEVFYGVHTLQAMMQAGDDRLTIAPELENPCGDANEWSVPPRDLGQAGSPTTFPMALAGTLFASLGAGADQLILGRLLVGNDLKVYGGLGDDQVHLCHTTVVDDTTLFTEFGNDTVRVHDSVLGDAVNANLGHGDNRGELERSRLGSLQLASGNGVDRIHLDDVAAARDLFMNVLGGHDVVQLSDVQAQRLHLHLGYGDDAAQLHDLALRSDLFLYAGAGQDRVELISTTSAPTGLAGFAAPTSQIGGRLYMDLGTDADQLTIRGDSQRRLSVGRDVMIFGGSGNDRLQIQDLSAVADSRVFLGSGNDALTVVGMDVGRRATFDLGTGDDQGSIRELRVTDQLMALLHAGDDTLEIRSISAARSLYQGGAGPRDRLRFWDASLDLRTVREFEFVERVEG